MQSTSSVRTFRPSAPEEPNKPKKDKKQPKQHKPIKLPKLPRLPKGRLPWFLVFVLVLLSVFLLQQYREAKQKLQAPTPASKAKQVNSVVSRVGKLIILPTGEKPTVITVKDASKLKGEQFYANAKDGDVTLVYPQHKKAVLYRPSDNIIVNVAAVNVTSGSTTAQ